jgi:enoyl-CoA hydratase
VPIHLETTDRVATVTIDRTHRRNALNLEATRPPARRRGNGPAADARALVLTGAEGHFCSGADLTELEDESFTSRLAEVLEHLAAAPVTTVAAIEGSCMGLGMQLAVACDVRVVGPTATFAVPVAKLGLMVDHWNPRPGRPHLG